MTELASSRFALRDPNDGTFPKPSGQNGPFYDGTPPLASNLSVTGPEIPHRMAHQPARELFLRNGVNRVLNKFVIIRSTSLLHNGGRPTGGRCNLVVGASRNLLVAAPPGNVPRCSHIRSQDMVRPHTLVDSDNRNERRASALPDTQGCFLMFAFCGPLRLTAAKISRGVQLSDFRRNLGRHNSKTGCAQSTLYRRG